MMKPGAKIKIKMIQAGISGASIARDNNVDRTAIYHVIAGRSKSPKLRCAIADALGVKISELWPDDDQRVA